MTGSNVAVESRQVDGKKRGGGMNRRRCRGSDVVRQLNKEQDAANRKINSTMERR
jgi:hypothetical protein